MSDFWTDLFIKDIVPVIVREYNPERIIIFGSRAKGSADENSDIDAIIISREFDSIPFIQRMPALLKKIDFRKHIDFICYTPEEFNIVRNTSSVVQEALETGYSL